MKNNIEKKLEQARAQKKATWITLRLVLALVLFVLTLFLFVAIADQIVIKNRYSFDKNISDHIHSIVSPTLTKVIQVITFFGSANFLFPAYIVLILFYLLTKKSRLALDITMI